MEKKSYAGIKPVEKLLQQMDFIQFDWKTECKTCIAIEQDELDTRKVTKCRWWSQTINEANMLKNTHESNSEGHECEVLKNA